MNSLKDFKVACGNRSGLNCKFYISRGVVAVSNSILHPRRHILIRSYTERKLQQGVKNTSCLISYFFIFFFSLKTQKNYRHLLHNISFLFSFYLFVIASSHQINLLKNKLMSKLLAHSTITKRSAYYNPKNNIRFCYYFTA